MAKGHQKTHQNIEKMNPRKSVTTQVHFDVENSCRARKLWMRVTVIMILAYPAVPDFALPRYVYIYIYIY